MITKILPHPGIGTSASARSVKPWICLTRPAEILKNCGELGFTAALLVPKQGIFCGNSSLVTLAEGPFDKRILKKNLAQSLKWETGGYNDYPSSQMGVIALIRQTLLDAQWYQQAQTAYKNNPVQPAPESNISLEKIFSVLGGGMPLLADISTMHRLWQLQTIENEFGLKPGCSAMVMNTNKLRLLRKKNHP